VKPLRKTSIAEVRNLDVVPLLATVFGVSPVIIRRRLGRVRGNMKLEHAFAELWPEGRLRIAALTVATARALGLVDELCSSTQMSKRAVERRLAEIDAGQTLLRTAFPELGVIRNDPEEDEPADDEVDEMGFPVIRIGDLTVAVLREYDVLVDDAIRHAGYRPAVARAALEAARGNTKVRTVLEPWPRRDEPRIAAYEELGTATARATARSPLLQVLIARFLQMTTSPWRRTRCS
jgi:hypothetical protein